MKQEKKYKARWNRILVAFMVPVIFIFLIYFGFIKDYEKERLLKIGYNQDEITSIREHLVKEERKILSDYPYLSYLLELINHQDYRSERLISYIDYISKLTLDYQVDDIIFLVNHAIPYPYSEKLLAIIHHPYFILSRLDRYIQFESDDIDKIITSINANLDSEFYTDGKTVDVSQGPLMLINKYYQLDKEYQVDDLVTMESSYSNNTNSQLSAKAYEAFKKLVDDSEKEGYHIRNNYAYRSYDYQNGVYEEYKQKYGFDYAEQYAARPGYSEHQTGLALDVGVQTRYASGKFETSKEFIWMKENAHLYGFILRYPKDKENITGYHYEPWHYRYVGVDAATYIHENDITFDEYYAYFIEK